MSNIRNNSIAMEYKRLTCYRGLVINDIFMLEHSRKIMMKSGAIRE